MAILLQGMGEFVTALKAASTAVDLATRAATATAAHLVEAQIKTSLARATHPKGTPTPSQPGSPPALVSGRLRNSVRVDGPVKIAPGTWQAQIGPTAVYGRVQELGGGPVPLPSRPYAKPSLEQVQSSGQLGAVYRATWLNAIKGG